MRLVLFLCTLFVGHLAWAGDFEGIIFMKNTHDGRSMNMDWYGKSGKVRIEAKLPEGQVINTIMDPTLKKAYSLMPEQKMCMEISLTETVEASRTHQNEYTVVRTGKKDTVAGTACEIFITKEKKTGREMNETCLAKGLSNYAALWESRKISRQSADDQWMEQYVKEGYFPIRMITRKDGKEDMRMEATKVEKKKLDDKLFAPPSDYKCMDMTSMLQAFGAQPAPGSSGSTNQNPQVDVNAIMQNAMKQNTPGR